MPALPIKLCLRGPEVISANGSAQGNDMTRAVHESFANHVTDRDRDRTRSRAYGPLPQCVRYPQPAHAVTAVALPDVCLSSGRGWPAIRAIEPTRLAPASGAKLAWAASRSRPRVCLRPEFRSMSPATSFHLNPTSLEQSHVVLSAPTVDSRLEPMCSRCPRGAPEPATVLTTTKEPRRRRPRRTR